MRTKIFLYLSIFIILSGCAKQKTKSPQGRTKKEATETSEIVKITHLSSSELKKLIDEKNKDYLLIDVRSKGEYASGHIPTAINIPHTQIEKRTNEIPKDRLIVVYCKVGSRSSVAESKLKELGYKNVLNFGGINSYPYKLEK